MRPPDARIRRPTVVIAYGEAGAAWLRKLAGRCSATPELKPLIESCTLQFWLISGEGADKTREPFRRVPPDVEATALRELVDGGRSERARGANPDLNVREVLVLERWSLFGANCAPRTTLRACLRTAQRLGCNPGATIDDFEYDWVCLADGVRDAPEPCEDRISRARDQVLDYSIRSRTFFVDRVSSGGAIVDPDLADECHYHLAMAYLNSDVGAPRVGMDMDTVPIAVRSQVESDDTVVPLSVSLLVHRRREILASLTRTFRAKCAAGLEDVSEIRTLVSASTFDKALDDDLNDIRSGRLDQHVARVRRVEAARAALTWAVATRTERDVALTVTGVRQRLLKAALPLQREGEAALAGMAAVLLQGTSSKWWVVLVLVALGVAGALYVWFRRRGRSIAGPSESASAAPSEGQASVEEATAEWERLCADMTALLSAWQDGSGRAQSGELSLPIWEQVPPLAWELGDGFRVAIEGAPVTSQLLARLSRDSLDAVQRGEAADTAIDDACRTFIRRYRETDKQGTGGFVADALTSAEPLLRRTVTQRPFLVRTGAPITASAVAWLAAPDLELASALEALEPPETRDVTVVLAHSDPDVSVRIALGERLRWQDILSLGSLTAA